MNKENRYRVDHTEDHRRMFVQSVARELTIAM